MGSRFSTLAVDFDGTLASEAVVVPRTIDALERVLAKGYASVLVTGRRIGSLEAVFDRLDLFARIVAENGALLFDPTTRQERLLADAPPARFVAALRARNVLPLDLGRVIVATREPNERVVLDTIREERLDLELSFNKSAVMVLPKGVNKASGVRAALATMGVRQEATLAIGDAENDHALFDACGLGIAVANAVTSLKARAHMVTAGANGAGVVETVERWLTGKLG